MSVFSNCTFLDNSNKVAQAQIIALTSQYYAAKTGEDRKAIQAKAEGIRKDPRSKEKVVSPLNFQSNAISTALSEAAAKGKASKLGGMSADQWKDVINRVGITSSDPEVTKTRDSSIETNNKHDHHNRADGNQEFADR